MQNRFFVRKVRVKVQLQMTDGVSMNGDVFINSDSRVLDLLNHNSTFIPIEAEDGSIHLVNKFEILRLTPTGHKRLRR